MPNDDLNSGDEPPEKVGKSIARTRAPDSARIFGAPDVAGQEDVHESTQPRTQETPMAGATQLNRFENFQLPRELIGIGSDYADIHGSESIKNSVRAQGNIPWSGQTFSDGQETPSNNFMVNTGNTVQSNISVLDESVLKPGTGSNAEVTGGISSNAESEILLRIPNCNFQVVSGYSTFPNHGNVFSGLAQNMSDHTRSDVNLGITRASSSNVRSNVVWNLNAQPGNRERRHSLPGYVVGPTKPQDVRPAGLSSSHAAGLQSTVHQGVTASDPSPKKPRLEVDPADNVLKRGANAMQSPRCSARIQEKRQKTSQHQTQLARTHVLPCWPPHLRRRRTNIAQPPLALASPPPSPPARPSSPVTVQAAHIKGPDMVMDHPPRLPMGRKCYLCKRDLAFTPEGLFNQQDLPPAVAVLACGHAFHDRCLQDITPKDQAEDPPCIPCAIGES